MTRFLATIGKTLVFLLLTLFFWALGAGLTWFGLITILTLFTLTGAAIQMTLDRARAARA